MKESFIFKQLPKMLYKSILCSAMIANAAADGKLDPEDIKPNDAVTEVSVDSFSLLKKDGTPFAGKSTGDLVLFMYDASGTTRRKKSFLLDLSLQDKDSKINDLTFKDILAIKGQVTIVNEDLTDFIQSSKDSTQISWQIFVINNQFEPGEKFGNIDLINFGLAVTELEHRKEPLGIQQLHQSKVHRANVILENNDYGLVSNDSFVSYTGESAAYNEELHKHLTDGAQAVGRIDQTLHFGAHRLQLIDVEGKKAKGFTTTYQYIGDFALKHDKSSASWQLIFSSKR